MAGFVFVRVRARLLTRSRQEWRYALRMPLAAAEIIDASAAEAEGPPFSGAAFESLDRALSQLPATERWLLDQLFWEHRTQAGIAAELHISQAAVSKRRRIALVHLRAGL
jgi:DNA-directed RNA polymerase specialized sigma24 family protein